jgi:hypothetical protein
MDIISKILVGVFLAGATFWANDINGKFAQVTSALDAIHFQLKQAAHFQGSTDARMTNAERRLDNLEE